MQLKSFSWAEQIFTAYFAESVFAWRKVLPLGLACLVCIHTFTDRATRGPPCAKQVADKQAPRSKHQRKDVAGVSQTCVLGPAPDVTVDQ